MYNTKIRAYIGLLYVTVKVFPSPKSTHKHAIFFCFSFPLSLYPSSQNTNFSLPHSHFSAVTPQRKDRGSRQLGKSLTPVSWLNGALLDDYTEEGELFAQKGWTEEVREAAENLLDFVVSKQDGKLLYRSFRT